MDFEILSYLIEHHFTLPIQQDGSIKAGRENEPKMHIYILTYSGLSTILIRITHVSCVCSH